MDAIVLECTTKKNEPGIIVLTEERVLWVDGREKAVVHELKARDIQECKRRSPTILEVRKKDRRPDGSVLKKDAFSVNLTEPQVVDHV